MTIRQRLLGPRLLTLTLLALAILALFHRLLAGEVLFWGLPSLQFYPWREFAFDELRAGRLPAWNPYVGAGAPLLANYQTAVFYPPNWFHLLLPDGVAMSVIAMLHVVWAGWGMWLFAGSLDLDDFGRGVSTLAYALGGYLIARFGSFPTATTGAWIPWLFWMLHGVLHRRQGWYAAGLGLVFGLQLLAGHAQTTWYGGVGLGLYALWIVGWQQRDEPYRARARGLVLAGVGAVLGVAVAAIQLVPTAEYLMESQRSGGLDYDTTANLSYSPFRLVTLFSPNFYGTPADGSYITKGIFFEDATYIGFIPIVAALAAVVARMRKRRDLPDHPALRTVPFWALLALAVLVIAMGRYGPVFRLLYDHVPTFDAFREPVRWLILVALALSVLAGIGVGYWGRGKWIVFWSRLAAAGGGAMALMAFGFVEFGQPDSPNLEVLSRGLVVLGAWIVCAALLTLVRPDEATGTSPLLWRSAVLIFIAVDLTWAGTGLNPTVPADFYDSAEITQPAGRIYWFEDYREDVTFGTEKDEDELPAWGEIDGYFNLSDYRIARDNWREVRASLLPNMAMLDEVSALNNNDPLLPGHFGDYVDLIEARGAEAVPLLRAAGVSRVYGRTPPGWDTIVQNDTITYTEAPDGEFPAAWLVSEAVWADSDEQITEALTQPDWDPYTTVVLAGKAPDTLPDEPITGTVELVEDQPTKRRFRVTADGPGFLVISSAFYPGWSAEIDGEDTPLYRANLTFQAVRVPEGQSEVILTYWPRRFWIGALVSGLAILGAVAWIIVDSRRRAPRSTDD